MSLKTKKNDHLVGIIKLVFFSIFWMIFFTFTRCCFLFVSSFFSVHFFVVHIQFILCVIFLFLSNFQIQSFSQFVQKFIHLTSSSSSYLIKTRAMLLKSSVPFLCSVSLENLPNFFFLYLSKITSLIIIGIAITGMMIHWWDFIGFSFFKTYTNSIGFDSIDWSIRKSDRFFPTHKYLIFIANFKVFSTKILSLKQKKNSQNYIDSILSIDFPLLVRISIT